MSENYADDSTDRLVVREISSGYGRHQVLDAVSLSVRPGRITALAGVNGAGKSTLLSTIAGLVGTRSGQILLDGSDITSLSASDRVAKGICLCPQGRRILVSLTVEENLLLGAWVRGSRAVSERRDWLFAEFPVLAEKRRSLGGELSGGQQQMLALARSLMSSPRVLMVDEPSMGLAPAIVRDVYALLKRLREIGVAIVLAEEHLRLLESVADEIHVLSRGRLWLASGPGNEDAGDVALRILAGEEAPLNLEEGRQL